MALEARLPFLKMHVPAAFAVSCDLRHWPWTGLAFSIDTKLAQGEGTYYGIDAIWCFDVEFRIFGEVTTLTRLP